MEKGNEVPEQREPSIRFYEELDCWVVWGKETAEAALREEKLSSETLDAVNLGYLPADVHEQCTGLIETMRRWFVLMDGDNHREARRAVQPMFSPRRIRQSEQAIGDIVDGVLDDFEAGGDDDVSTGVAARLSARTIAYLLGLPGDDEETLHRWAYALADFLSMSYRRDHAIAAQAALDEIQEFIRTSAEQDSVLTKAAGDEQDRLATTSMLLFGGLETTAGLAGLALWSMLGTGRQDEVARSGSGTEARELVEQALKWYAPLGHVARTAVEDVEIGGSTIAKGDLVMISLTGHDMLAERWNPGTPVRPDPAVRPDHVAFGHGLHYCVGAPLARLAVSELVTRFARRFPGASIREVQWRRNPTFRGFEHFYVNLPAAAART